MARQSSKWEHCIEVSEVLLELKDLKAGPKAHLLVCSPVCRQHEMSTEGSLGRGRMALGGG